MSIVIQPEAVVAVLLADTWYDVDPGSFVVDSYEYAGTPSDTGDDGSIQLGGHRVPSPSGFAFVAGGETFAGPLTAVLALRSKANAA